MKIDILALIKEFYEDIVAWRPSALFIAGLIFGLVIGALGS